MTFHANLGSDNVKRATEAALPEFIADHGDLRVGRAAGIAVLGSEQASENWSGAKLGVRLAGDGDDTVQLENTTHFDVGSAAISPSEQAGEDALVSFDLAKHRIGKRRFAVVTDQRKLDDAFGLTDGKFAEQQRVDEREDGGVGADAEGQREDSDRRETGVLGEDADHIAEI